MLRDTRQSQKDKYCLSGHTHRQENDGGQRLGEEEKGELFTGDRVSMLREETFCSQTAGMPARSPNGCRPA